MRYAIVEGGVVANIIEADEPFLPGMVPDDGTAIIGGTWDGTGFGPVVIALPDAQAQKIASLYASYLAACTADVAYMGTIFQADDRSTSLLNGAVTSYTLAGSVPSGFYWRDANNNNVPITLAQLQGLGQSVTTQVWAAFQHMQTLKAQVLAATTTAAVQAINW